MSLPLYAQSGKQIETSLKIDEKTSVPYLQYLPKGFDPSKKEQKYPLILFLHGRGESNGPLSIVKKWGPPKLAESKKASLTFSFPHNAQNHLGGPTMINRKSLSNYSPMSGNSSLSTTHAFTSRA
jgi:hypothetical protein